MNSVGSHHEKMLVSEEIEGQAEQSYRDLFSASAQILTYQMTLRLDSQSIAMG
jgi:hypothetical protein